MRVIQQIGFVDTDQGPVIEIDYVDTDNMRVGGKVTLLTHAQVHMSHPDYREDGEELLRAAERLLDNALDDWSDSEPVGPELARDEDDDEGMGMGYGDRS